MNNSITNTRTILDEESGISLTYNYREDSGWSFQLPHCNGDREKLRQAILLSPKHWPKVSDEDQERFDKYNDELLSVTRSIIV